MVAPTKAAEIIDGVIDSELAALEQRLGLLIAHAKVLRATNDNLRRDLAAAEE